MEAETFEVEPNRVAEEYRNYQPAVVPAHVENHLDFIDICEGEGYMLLGCSNLNSRYWTGSIWYFMEPESAPDVEKCLTGVECESGVCDGKFLEDKEKIFVAEDSGVVEVMQLSEVADEHVYHFTTLGTSCEHDDSVLSLSVFPDKTIAVSGSMDMSVKVWDVDTLVSEHTYRPAHIHQVQSVSAHPEDNAIFASCSLDGTALVWDTRLSKPARCVSQVKGCGLTAVAWQPGRFNTLAVGATNGDVSLIDTRQERGPLSKEKIFKRALHRLVFSDECVNLLAACADTSYVKVIDYASEKPAVIYTDDRHSDFVRGLCWNPKTRQLHSCGWDKQILVHQPVKMEVNGV